MKAAMLHGPRDIRLVDVEVPQPKADEILIRVQACGICGTDIHAYRTGVLASEGKIPGYEFSGVVAEVGRAVEGVTVGERVAGTGYRNCGRCYWCRHNQPLRCPSPLVPGEGLDGAFAEYVIVPNPMPGKMLFHLPDDMSWAVGATLEPLSVACFAVSRARIEAGEKVVVFGAGMIGQCIIRICRTLGATVIVSELSALRRQTATQGGAELALDPRQTDLEEAVTETTAGAMASVLFECSGSPSAFKQAPRLLRPFGRIIQVGIFEQKLEIEPELMALMFAYRNLTLRGSGGQRWDMAMNFLETNPSQTERFMSHSFPLKKISEAFETQSDSEKSIKVIVRC